MGSCGIVSNHFRVIFQHDNDPKHIAKLVKQWLSMQNFDVLTWPPQRPYLNPMKHVWALVKRYQRNALIVGVRASFFAISFFPSIVFENWCSESLTQL